MTRLSFSDPDVARALERMAAEELDALPFGVIRLSPDGSVRFFSVVEAQASGYPRERALGRRFFETVAPCMDTLAFRGRLEAEARRGEVDLELGHTGDFRDPARFVRFRICSATGGGYWLLTQR